MNGDASSALSNFHFTTIGKEPALLKRLSEPTAGGEAQNSPSPSPSPTASPEASIVPVPPSTSRKSLLKALAGIAELMPGAVQQDSMAGDASHPSGAPTMGLQSSGKVASGSNGNTAPVNATEDRGTSPASFPGDHGHVQPSRPILNTFLPMFNGAPLISHTSGSPEQASSQQDDAMSVFRHALQRLQAESEEYARREEATRQAMAHQQVQAARWHARADALLESLSTLFAQCEQRVASASHAVAEVERLRELVRRHEQEGLECHSKLASVESRNAELERMLAEQKSAEEALTRQTQERVEELTRAAVQTNNAKARLQSEVEVLRGALQAAESSAKEREQYLLAQLEEQKRLAAQEKQKLLGHLEEAKRTAAQDRQRRMAGLELLEGQPLAKLEAHRRGNCNPEEGKHGDLSQARANGANTVPQPGSHSQPTPAAVEQDSMSGAASHPSRKASASRSPEYSPTLFDDQGPGKRRVTQSNSAPPLPDLKPLCIPQTNHGSPPISPVHGLPAKPEFCTPVLRDPVMSRRGVPPETPTFHRLKPEPSPIGHHLGLGPSNVPQAGTPSNATVKPERSTPSVERRLAGGHGIHSGSVARREQSLDYQPIASRSQNGASPAMAVPDAEIPAGGQPPPAIAHTSSSHRGETSSRSQAGVDRQASETHPPVVSLGMSSSELPPESPALPELAYPSRTPSNDAVYTSGVFETSSQGPTETQALHEPGPRGITGQEQTASKRGRGAREKERAAPVNSPPLPTLVSDRSVPAAGRQPLYRAADLSPERPKRRRDEEESPEGPVPRRRRMTPPPSELPAFRPAEPLPPRPPPASYERPRSPSDARRQRSPPSAPPPIHNTYVPRGDHYSPRPPPRYPPSPVRRRSPTPPPPPPGGASAEDPYSYGYAPPPEAGRRETDVHFPQVVAAPVPVRAGGPVRAANATPRPRKSTAPSPAAAAHAARGAPGGSAVLAPEETGKIALLERMGPSAGEGARKNPTAATAKPTSARPIRGGGPKNAARGRRGGGNPATRNGNALQAAEQPALLKRMTSQSERSLASRISVADS
ncbi:hypothetical protein BN946_scf184979.g18 [Trametes cinnabarina]|uniref:Uncharacterized protein n=1 Tax=Pycnoporus cinnabarinus TaxID=5643 RepID=A0A060SPU5_PYCCI|nr:hypothetical protein BN946_scf184979.g18 [Trametes cinnabarina]